MLKRVLIPASQLVNRTGLGVRCFLLGLLSSVMVAATGALALIVVGFLLGNWIGQPISIVIGLLAALGVWVYLPWSVWRQFPEHISSIRLLFIAATCYSVGFGILPVTAALLAAFFPSSESGAQASVWNFVSTVVAVTIEIATANLIAWFLWKRLRGRVEYIGVRPKPKCPGCDYDLIGNQSLICPECGRAFTYEELGATADDFRRQQILAKAVLK